MTSLITLPNDHFAVTVPEGARSFQIDNTMGQKLIWKEGKYGASDEWIYEKLPPGSYTIVALGSEISEEQAAEICDKIKCGHPERTVYCDYPGGSDWLDTGDWVETALESFRSLLASLSIEASTTLILKQNK